MVDYDYGMVMSRSVAARVHCGEETEGGADEGQSRRGRDFRGCPLRLRQFFQIGNTVRSIN